MSNLKQHVVHLTTQELKEIIDERLAAFGKKNHQSEKSDKNYFPELLTRQEVANIFEVSFVTLHKWVKHGVLPRPIKKGKMVYFLKKDIVASINHKND